MQSEIIQIRVTKQFKDILKIIASKRGLALSTYVKFILIENFKTDPLWNSIQNESELEAIFEEFIDDLQA